MAQKILGIDLGSSSIGIALRNPDLGKDLLDQIEYFSVDVFKAGVGINKAGEYSFAAERTKHRQSRRLYETRRRRLWATLELLIKVGFCPMKIESLIKWKTYDKGKGLLRQYPLEDKSFDQWIKLDFDGDGFPDYTSPYQLREELIERQFDFSNEIERYKLGRALYHIAQRRGFQSSKGETIKEQEDCDNSQEDIVASMKKSEERQSKDLVEFMRDHDLPTVGCAFAMLERKGVRVRNSRFKPIRAMYREEIKKIFDFQEGLSTESELFIRIMSTKKGEGTIFYKKPLRSQKGQVGNCTLEKNKKRCPIGHPFFEYFRAWTFLNNIKFRCGLEGEWKRLNFEQKKSLFNDVFTSKVRSDFQFKEIREKIERMVCSPLVYQKDEKKTINYKDTQNIAGCPVTARLVKLLGENWEDVVIAGNKQRISSGIVHDVEYGALDLWNICFNADDPEDVTEFSTNRLGWGEEETKLLLKLWSSIPQGYAMLSLKAIKNINFMLSKGLKYSDAVMLAKIPDLGDFSSEQIEQIINDYAVIKSSNDNEKTIAIITNTLIANHKSLNETERFAFHDYDYKLDDKDHDDIIKAIESNIGSNRWGNMDANEQLTLIRSVSNNYQNYFYDHKRDFVKVPRLEDAIKIFLKKEYCIDEDKLKKMYHPSQISLYNTVERNGNKSIYRLGDPNVGAIRNPVVLRAMNVLRRKINAMLDKEMISSEDTRIVVETTRSMNDANMRWAIETYQRERETERKTIEKILREFYPERDINSTDIDKASYLIEQTGKDNYKSGKNFAINVEKYKLWLEQGCQCMYTGKIISLANLLNGNECDIEHTIPRSKSFDNSDSNLTVCDSFYNRSIKKNLMPTQLPNYENDVEVGGVTYTAIKPRLEKWEEKVERLHDMVNFWKARSRNAQDKSRKDTCVRQRHLWQMQLDYWNKKLSNFTITEIKEVFRNSQLVDTGIITKYATLYLKSVFNNVEVQKGRNTATFRRILGIQSLDEKKDRDKHSHHAIDATVLTTMPLAAKRERMLQLFYEIKEAKSLGHDASHLERQLKNEVDDCGIGKAPERIVEIIENNILINHRYKDQTFTPNHKRLRINGKKVSFKDDGGKKISRWSDGDSIRGRLHKESYYGAIKLPIGDEAQKDYIPKVENGRFVYNDQKEDIFMVTREAIKDFKKENELDTIVDTKLKNQIKSIVNKRMNEGKSFVEAITEDIYLQDKFGNDIKTDKNGRKLSPIRHVRCRVKAGRGFMTYEKSLSIRKQINTSNKRAVNIPNRDYKRNLFAQNDNNYLFLLYEGADKGKVKRLSKIISLYEISLLAKTFEDGDVVNNLLNTSSYNSMIVKGVSYRLKQVFKVGSRILMLDEKIADETFSSLSPKELSERLFVVVKFNTTSSDHLYLRNHLNSLSGDGSIDLELVPAKINCLVEGQDFEVDELGDIHFY